MKRFYFCLQLITGLLIVCHSGPLRAQDAVCAKVKIEIEQEATFERQAFKAKMKVKNHLEGVSLQEVQVDLAFTKPDGTAAASTTDPNDTEALFFPRLDKGTLPGSVSGGTSLDLEWLIIPTKRAGGEQPQGTPYLAGAKLRYTVQGKEEIVHVQPDQIIVLPTPDLTLDYFLPRDVYADNPFTLEVEPIIPFSLGVRVSNTGFGIARNLQIESAQPKIVENEQGLLIDFELIGAQVGQQEVKPDLTVEFGDLPPQSSGIARWLMTTTLSGRFVEFTAEFSHADALGGATTSLISEVRTHELVGEVLVDRPQSDDQLDFLAKDGDLFFLYSSEGGNEEVTDLSDSASLTLSSGAYVVDLPASASMLYSRLPDPFNGNLEVRSAIRSDGKRMPEANVWLSQVWNSEALAFDHYLNLFDVSSTGQNYHVEFGAKTEAPGIEIEVAETAFLRTGELFQLPVQAAANNGLPVTISTGPLPVGATLEQTGEGIATLHWTPLVTQVGSFAVRFHASAGAVSTSQVVTLNVTDQTLFQSWRDQFWPGETDVAVIGASADPIGDGISNLLHYVFDQDPTDPQLPLMKLGVQEVDGLHYLTLTYLRRTGDSSLLVTVVGAEEANATQWSPVANEVPVDQTDVPAGMERVRVVDTVSLESVENRRLLRLRAELL